MILSLRLAFVYPVMIANFVTLSRLGRYCVVRWHEIMIAAFAAGAGAVEPVCIETC